MSSSNATGANFTGATLGSASCGGVDFSSANLTNANFTAAHLTSATGMDTTTLTGVIWSNTTCPDGTNSNTHSNTCVGRL